MEEDIKTIQEKLKIIESLCTDDCINKSTVIQPLIYAIENLIARYKELKEVEETIEYFKFCRGSLPKDQLLIVMCNEDFCRNFGNDFIPKFKIKDIYEKLNNDIDYFSKDLRKDLRELLED